MAKSTIVYLTSAVAAGLTIIGLVFNFISVGSDYWSSFGDSSYYYYLGLWRVCSPREGCAFIGSEGSEVDLPIWMIAARGLTVLSGIMSLVAISITVVTAFVQSPRLPIVAIIFALIAPFFLGGGLISWVGGMEGDFKPLLGSVNYGWSFALGWVGVGFYIAGAVTIGVQLYAHAVQRRRREPVSYNVLQDASTM